MSSPESAHGVSPRREATSARADARARVLLVDNDLAVSHVVEAILVEHGFEVCCVPSAEHGLEKLAAAESAGTPFGLVVLDLRMPGLGGLGFLDRVTARLPILVLSGFVSAEDRERLAENGRVVGVMEKPFDLRELAQIVQTHAIPTSGDESEARAGD